MKYKSALNRLIILIVFSAVFTIYAEAQDRCAQNLQNAQAIFQEGRYYEVEQYLFECIDNGFNKQERIAALQLLTVTYLYLDYPPKADSVYLKLLSLDPEHTVNALIDPPDLIFLHNSFRTKPIFSWRLIGGVNQTFERTIFSYTIIADPSKSSSTVQTGLTFGGGIQYHFYKKFSVNMDLKYSRNNYTKEESTLDNTLSLSKRKIMDWINIPVYIQYDFSGKRLRPYLFGGLSGNLLLGAQYNNLTKSQQGSGDVTLNEYNFKENTNFFNHSFFMGAGIMYKTSGIESLALDIEYGLGMSNITNEENRYSADELQREIINFGLASDAFRLDQLLISVKFIRPLYKPKKLY